MFVSLCTISGQVISMVTELIVPEKVNIVWSSRRFEGHCQMREKWFGTSYSCEGTSPVAWSRPVKWVWLSTRVWVWLSTRVWVCPSSHVWVCPSTCVCLWPMGTHNRCWCVSVGGCFLSTCTCSLLCASSLHCLRHPHRMEG